MGKSVEFQSDCRSESELVDRLIDKRGRLPMSKGVFGKKIMGDIDDEGVIRVSTTSQLGIFKYFEGRAERRGEAYHLVGEILIRPFTWFTTGMMAVIVVLAVFLIMMDDPEAAIFAVPLMVLVVLLNSAIMFLSNGIHKHIEQNLHRTDKE